MINLDEMYRTALVNRQSAEPIDVMRDGSEMIHLAQAAVPKGVEPAGTVRPGALAGEMRPIEQSVIESIMERTGASLEQIGMALDSLGKVKLGPLEIGIRDFLPFVGGSETVVDPITGKEEVVQVGTPAALQQMGRGESAVRGTGFATQMTPDVKLAAFDVPTIGAAAKVSAKAARRIGREIATTPPTGSVQMAPTPVQAPRSELGFYYAVEQTVANIPQAKGTGQQFLAQISKAAGVKPEELQWTGLDEFLKGKKSVTKAEIQDYLNANRVDVREVRFGQFSPEQSMARDKAINRYREITDSIADTRQKVEEGLLSSQEARAILEPLTAERNNLDRTINSINTSINTKFSQYTLPGGENYREILLTLPFKEPSMPKGYEVRTVQYDDGSVRYFADTPTTSSAGYKTEAEAQKELERMAGSLKDWRASQASFRSSHFDQPNILAHMRVNDRVVDGKKTLFIEEIQSDWHQAGRKKGYATSEKAELPEGTKVFEPGAADSPGQTNQAFTVQIPRAVNGRSLFYGTTREEALANAQSFIAQPSLGAVPDAPFKTSWHELTLKRAIQEASEKGYDQIAFTTGKTQVERYPEALRQVADDISWKSSGTPESGNRFIEIKKSGNTVLQAQVDSRGVVTSASNQEAVGKPIEELIGKPMGQQVVSEPSGSIKGEQFTVGGKGMEGFYDQILPKSLEKLGKKFDAKVGKTEMDGVEVWQMDITPKMRESAMSKGQPLFVAPVVAPGMVQDEESK